MYRKIIKFLERFGSTIPIGQENNINISDHLSYRNNINMLIKERD